jgi:hypothetical protein
VDTFVDEHGLTPPDIVKIDTEGAELQVLRGVKTLLESVRVIFCEIHYSIIDEGERREIVELLESNGFDCEELYARENGNGFLKATNR